MNLRRFSQDHSERSRTMKVAVVGAGFTGLAAAYSLAQKKHEVTVFEKEKYAGGLAGSFSLPGWQYPLEMHYHHWFTNDKYVFNLIKELNLTKYLIFPKSLTSIYFAGKEYPFNSPLHVLSFSPLTIIERLRTGVILLYLKLLPSSQVVKLEKYTASCWLKKYFGEKAYKILWQPLLSGKFGPYSDKVNMAWFWARIKKRTPQLGYLEGGYQSLIDTIVSRIEKNGGKVLLNTQFKHILRGEFDKVIATTPTPEFLQIFPKLPEDYKRKLRSISHLHALNLIITTKEKFLKNTYWLNINDRNFPFVGVIQHTNMTNAKYYGGKHITYIANYLPDGHPYLKMTKEELFKIYLPYLKKINPTFNHQSSIINHQSFSGSFAQPVFPINYSLVKPDFETPIPNVYLANMDMVYPWDRGTNYAIELGYKVAEIVVQSKPNLTN